MCNIIVSIYFLILFPTNLVYAKHRIIGGKACKLDDTTSFMVALTNKVGEHYCGGSLINPSWVLTAAHCKQRFTLYASDVFTRAKYVNKSGVLSEDAPVIKVIETIRHPEYNKNTEENDIALMKLEKEIDEKKVSTVQLPDSKNSKQPPEFCPTAAIMGWGDTHRDKLSTSDRLKCATIETISQADCQKAFKVIRIKMPKSVMCTKVNKKQDTCFGDSGGPLMCDNVQYGVVSWGLECAGDFPGVYTRVDHYLTFIKKHATPSRRSGNEGLHNTKLLLIIFTIIFNKIFSYI